MDKDIKELEEIIKKLKDWTFKSPFNPYFYKNIAIEKLEQRLYQKKYRINKLKRGKNGQFIKK